MDNVELKRQTNTSKYTVSVKRFTNSSVNRALIFQGGSSLGAYEAGAYKAVKELSRYDGAKGMRIEPIFHIIAGTSTGAMNAAILVSYVKENKTWEGSDERLVEFWAVYTVIC